MRRALQFAFFLWASLSAHAANFPISAGASQATVSSTITSASASAGNTVTFAAGSYTFTSAVNIPCSNAITIQGPTANPATAVINGSYTGNAFTVTGCTGGVTIQYLHTSGIGLLYLQPSDQNHITIVQNQCTNIQGNEQCLYIANTPSCCNAPVSGVSHPLTQNLTVQFNTFGDSGSCSGQMSGDNGGNCAGIISNTTELLNSNISYNRIIHTEEGIHFLQPGNFNGTNPQAVCVGCVVDYNYITQWHRIAIEIQNATPTNTTFVEHNLITSPTNAYFGTMGMSMPCCQQGFFQNVAGFAPGHIDNDNVQIDDTTAYLPCCQSGPVMADEFWGNAPIGENSLYQGQWHNGYSYGFGVTSAAAWRYNNVCGPVMQSKQTIYQYNAAPFYYSQEESGGSYPTQTGNTQGASCTTTPSKAPTITPGGGTISGPTSVTLAVPVVMTQIASGQNTTIYYTLDGSTPTTSSTVCNTPPATSCTVTANPGMTIKALTMWGTSGVQPTSHPGGYGYVPSAVVSAAFSSGGFFISPTGSDANPGTLASPWLTPNHAMTCGQVITAVSGTYSASNFGSGKWGTVTCPSSNNVAWLTCQTFDTCKISSGSSDALWVDKSYWGVVGWETTVTGGTTGACFHAGPSSNGIIVHHVIFADDIANGCKGGGFNSYSFSGSSATGSVDYITYLGNIAYNSASGTGACYSGINVYEPIASDNNSGTHIYTAGNFSFANIDGTPCGGVSGTTDGEGINYDTFDLSQATAGITKTGTDDTLTGWKPVCVIGSCSGGTPGGVDTPAATSQTINNASPSLDGASMLISETTNTTSTQTNALWTYLAGSCDSCATLSSDFQVFLGSNSAHASSFEFDMFNFDVTDNRDFMWGLQCNQSNGFWQISNQTSAWTNTTVACSLSYSAWHHIQVANHRILGDTSCSGVACQYYDTLTIDGVVHALNMILPSTTLPGGFASEVGNQFQIDIGPTTAPQTVVENIDQSTFVAGSPYMQQAVIHNNIEIGNGGRGIEVEFNSLGAEHANIHVDFNTMVGSGRDPHMAFPDGLAELGVLNAYNITAASNLVYTANQYTIPTHAYYALGMTNGNGTNTVAANYAAGIAGNNTYLQTSPGFTYGSNTLGTNPAFASTTTPGAPSCSGQASTAACMATLVSNLTPTASGAAAYGYQTPSNTSIVDALFPAWLCTGTAILNPNIPQGLITPGCGVTSSPTLLSGYQNNSGPINTMNVGSPSVQQTAFGHYSSGADQAMPDPYGNTAVWSSSNPSVLNVSSTGLITCLTPGTANSQVVSAPGGVPFSPWGWTCNPAPAGHPTGVTVIVISKDRGPQ